MRVELDEKVAEKVKELAISQGMTDDEMVQKIIEWYFEDCNQEE